MGDKKGLLDKLNSGAGKDVTPTDNTAPVTTGGGGLLDRLNGGEGTQVSGKAAPSHVSGTDSNGNQVSRRPSPMQTSVSGMPEHTAKTNLATATALVAKLVGAQAIAPKDDNKVTFTGTTDAGTMVKREYTKDGVTESRVAPAGQPMDQSTKINYTQDDVDKGRKDVKMEFDAAKDYLQSFYTQNKEALDKYWVHQADPNQKQQTPEQAKQSVADAFTHPQANMGVVPQSMGDAAKFTLEPNKNLFDRLSGSNADVRIAKDFFSASMQVMQEKYQQKKAEIENRYPETTFGTGGLGGVPVTHHMNEAMYDKEMKALDDQYLQDRQQFSLMAFRVATGKAINQELQRTENQVGKIDPNKVGMAMRKMLGESEEVDKMKAAQSRGVPLSAEQRVSNQLMGYQAMQTYMMQSFGDNRDAVTKELGAQVANYHKKILDANPDFKKQQIAAALSDKIYKDAQKNGGFWTKTLGVVRANMDDIRAAAKELGIPESDLSGARPEDAISEKDITVPRFGYAGQYVNGIVSGSAAPVYEFAMRHLIAPVAGAVTGNGTNQEALDRVFDHNWYEHHKLAGYIGGQTPSAASLFSGAAGVNTDAQSDNYLFNEANPEAGRWNGDFMNVAGVIAHGLGGFAGFSTGTNTLAGGAKMLGVGEQLAHKIGMGAYMYLSGYDNNKKEAMDMLGNSPDNEAKATFLANAYTLADIMGFEAMSINPSTVNNRIFSPKAMGAHEFVNLVGEKGLGEVSKTGLKNFFVEGIKTGVKDWAKLTTATELGHAGRMFADMMFAPEKFDQRQYAPEMIRSAVSNAIVNALPSMVGGFSQAKTNGQMRKDMMFEVGSNPMEYINTISRDLDQGKIDPVTGRNRLQVVNALSDIVKNGMPAVSPVNGEPLTDMQKKEYTSLLFQEKVIKDQKDRFKDDVAGAHYDERIKELQDQRNQILANAGHDYLKEIVEHDGIAAAEPPVATAEQVQENTPKEGSSVTDQGGEGTATHPFGFTEEPEGVQALADAQQLSAPEITADQIAPGENYYDASGNQYHVSGEKDGNLDVTLTEGNKSSTVSISREELAAKLAPAAEEAPASEQTPAVSQSEAKPQTPQYHTFTPEQITPGKTYVNFAERTYHVTETPEKDGKQEVSIMDSSGVARKEWLSRQEIADKVNNIEITPSEIENRGSYHDADHTRYHIKSEKDGQLEVFVTPKGEKTNTEYLTREALVERLTGKAAQTAPENSTPETENAINSKAPTGPVPVSEPAAKPEQDLFSQPADNRGADNFFDAKKTPQEEAETSKVSPAIRDKFAAAEKTLGHAASKTLPNGKKLKGRYVLTDSEALTPSHDPHTFSDSEGFPMLEGGRNPNDRDYSLEKNKNSVLVRAANYDGRAVNDIPTVDKNGVVIDGNDRTMSGIIAGENGTDGAYLEALKENAAMYGFTPEQVDQMSAAGKHPRLVFVPDKVEPYSTETFAQFNKETKKAKTPLEIAIEMRRTLPEDVVTSVGNALDGHEDMSAFYKSNDSQREVYKALQRAKIITADNADLYFDQKKGAFTAQGKELLQNVMMSKALSEDALRTIQQYPSLIDKVVRGIKNVMGIESSGIPFSDTLSNTVHLIDQVEQYVTKSKMSKLNKEAALELYLRQASLFERGDESAAAVQLYHVLTSPAKKAFKSFTEELNNRARQYAANPGMDLFGNETPSKLELLKQTEQALQHYEQAYDESSVEPADAGQPGLSDTTQAAGDIQGTRSTDQADGTSRDNGQQSGGTESQTVSESVNTNADAPENTTSSEVSPAEATAPGEGLSPDASTTGTGKSASGAAAATEEPVAEHGRGDKHAENIAEYNKYKDVIAKKLRKIELLQDRNDAGSADWKMELAKEEQALKTYRNKASILEKVIAKEEGKAISDNIRKLKIKTKGMALTTPLQIPVALYNAAIEIIASGVSAGEHIAVAVQRGIDFINDRFNNNWDEQKLKDLVGATTGGTMTADQIRSQKHVDQQLNGQNQAIADRLLHDVHNNKTTLRDVISQIEGSKLSIVSKGKIIDYITKNQYRVPGETIARDLIQKNNGDYDAALKELKQQQDVDELNTTDPTELENLKMKYAASKTAIETEKTIAGIKDGTIKPASILPNETNPFEIPEQTRWQKVAQATRSRFARLAQAQKLSVEEVTKDSDAVSAYRLANAKGLAKIEEIRKYLGDTHYVKDSFFDRLKNAGVDIQQFGLYMYAKHAAERNEQNATYRQSLFDNKVRELNEEIATAPTSKKAELEKQLQDILDQKDPNFVLMPDGGSGMSNKAAEEILDEVKKDGKQAEFEKFAKEFRENVVDKILEFKFETGMLKDSEYLQLKDHYSNYVPLKIDMDALMGDGEAKPVSSGNMTGRELYRSTGAAEVDYSNRTNPVLQSIVDLEYSMVKGEQNLANIRMANLVRLNKNDSVWEVRPAMYDVVHESNGKVAGMVEKGAPKDAIPFWEKGIKSYIVIHDPGLRNTFKRIEPTMVLQAAQHVTSFVRTYATLKNPSFILTNPLLDTWDAGLTSLGQGKKEVFNNFVKYAARHPKVAIDIMRGKGEWADWAKDWEAQGGKVSFLKQVGLDEQSEKTLKNYEKYGKVTPAHIWKSIGRSIENVSEGLESATRVIAYRSAVEAGMDKEKAAVFSRDATVDFEMSGTHGVYINAFKAFANASIQGNFNLIKNLATSKRVRMLAGGVVLFGAAQAWLADMMSDCSDPEDCYWELPEYKKQKSIVIPLKLMGGKGYFTPPIGRHLGWFNYVGQQLYELGKNLSTGDQKKGADPGDFVAHVVGSFFDYFNPAGGTQPLAQQLAGNAAPIAGYAMNQNAFGTPIKPDNVGPEHLNFFPKTPDAFVKASQFLSEHSGGDDTHEGKIEVSPNTIDYTFQSIFSGTYQFMKDIGSIGFSVAHGEAPGWEHIPFLNRFYRPSNMSKTKERTGKLMDKAKRTMLTDEEHQLLKDLLERQVHGDQITQDQADNRLKYAEMNQKKIESNAQKRKEAQEGAEKLQNEADKEDQIDESGDANTSESEASDTTNSD